jgi:hypothetical protein
MSGLEERPFICRGLLGRSISLPRDQGTLSRTGFREPVSSTRHTFRLTFPAVGYLEFPVQAANHHVLGAG